MKTEIYKHIELLTNRYPVLGSVKNEITEAYSLLAESYKNGGKLLVAGNGGSAADAEHIVGELMKGFKLPRKPNADFADKLVKENKELGTVLAENLQGALPAIALDGHPALSTAYMNDCEPLLCFAQQVNGYRVFFTSRKTLLNEFNHFEGNMNIFQPAIDITETALQKEVTDIENKLIQLRAEYATVH